MEINIKVDDINYKQLVMKFLPMLPELSDEPLLNAVSYVPASLAGGIIDHIPQSVLDDLVVKLVEKKKEAILSGLENYMASKDIQIKLSDKKKKK